MISEEDQKKERKRAYQKEYYAKNRERILEKFKKQKDERAEYYKQYCEKNKERIKEKRKEYQAKNRERINQVSREWAKKNFEKNSEKVREARRIGKEKRKNKDPQRYNKLLRKYAKKYEIKMVEELKDCYVRSLLCKHGVVARIPATNIPQELVEAKRLEIKIRRLVNEKCN